MLLNQHSSIYAYGGEREWRVDDMMENGESESETFILLWAKAIYILKMQEIHKYP